MYVAKCMYVSLLKERQVQVPTETRGGPQEEGLRSSETEVTGGRELPDVGAGNRTGVLCKNIKSSSLLSHLSNPTFAPF